MLAYYVPLVKRQRVRLALSEEIGVGERTCRNLNRYPRQRGWTPSLRSAVLPQIRAFEFKGKLAIVDPQRRVGRREREM